MALVEQITTIDKMVLCNRLCRVTSAKKKQEMGNMFADYFKQIARYNSERKGWYVYDGSVWRPDKGNLKVSELAKLLADKLYVFALTITEEDARKRFIDRVRKLQLRKNRETMLRDAMSVYPISMQAFDRNKYFFNCKNGTLDMRTLEFREHRPEDYLTMESGCLLYTSPSPRDS